MEQNRVLAAGSPCQDAVDTKHPSGHHKRMFETLCQQHLNIRVVLLKITGFSHSRKKADSQSVFSLGKSDRAQQIQ